MKFHLQIVVYGGLQFCTITIGICMYRKTVLSGDIKVLVSDAFPQR